jgi:hypothetical protein
MQYTIRYSTSTAKDQHKSLFLTGNFGKPAASRARVPVRDGKIRAPTSWRTHDPDQSTHVFSHTCMDTMPGFMILREEMYLPSVIVSRRGRVSGGCGVGWEDVARTHDWLAQASRSTDPARRVNKVCFPKLRQGCRSAVVRFGGLVVDHKIGPLRSFHSEYLSKIYYRQRELCEGLEKRTGVRLEDGVVSMC